jgi:hypothetical protein
MRTANRSLLASGLLAALAGCSTTPTVEVPDTNAKLLGAVDAGPVPSPAVVQLPAARYPYRVVPVRGVASQAIAVVMDVNQTGNPLAASVNRLDESFCAEVPLVEPADYDIAVTSQADDGRTSNQPGHLRFVYDPTAPDLPQVTLCQGERPSR